MTQVGHAAAHILLVEDERQIARFVELELLHEGYRVTVVRDGVNALIQAREEPPDVIILDLMLPGVDGLEVCRRLRSSKGAIATPIIMVTARDSIPDRVTGLSTGADDYLTKPFSIEELLARVASLLRRTRLPTSAVGEHLSCGDLHVNLATRTVMRGGRTVELSAKEYDLLGYLLRHPQQVLTRDQIYDAVWGYDGVGESNVIDVYVGYLRAKLDRGGPRLIHTVRGVGYVLRVKEP